MIKSDKFNVRCIYSRHIRVIYKQATQQPCPHVIRQYAGELMSNCQEVVIGAVPHSFLLLFLVAHDSGRPQVLGIELSKHLEAGLITEDHPLAGGGFGLSRLDIRRVIMTNCPFAVFLVCL